MTGEISAAQIEATRHRIASMNDPQEIANILRESGPHPLLEEMVKARLAEIDGGWLLDRLGRLRRPMTASQLDQAAEGFADMDSPAIVRQLLAELYSFHPDVVPLAEARLAELDSEGGFRFLLE